MLIVFPPVFFSFAGFPSVRFFKCSDGECFLVFSGVFLSSANTVFPRFFLKVRNAAIEI